MAQPKFVDGKIKYMLRTFDGSYVTGEMFESEAKVLLSNAKTDASVIGYELVSEPYRFETEEMELKLNRSKKEKPDETRE